MQAVIRSLVISAAAFLTLAGCNQTTTSAPAAGAPSAASASPMSGASCKVELDDYRAVMANDLATGNVNVSVHTRIARELDRAESACAAGRDAESIRMIQATKGRFGYR